MAVEFELYKARRCVHDGEDVSKWVTTYKNDGYTLYFVEDGEENYVNVIKDSPSPLHLYTDGINIAATGTLNMSLLTEFMQELAFAQATYNQIKHQFAVHRIN